MREVLVLAAEVRTLAHALEDVAAKAAGGAAPPRAGGAGVPKRKSDLLAHLRYSVYLLY